MNYVNHGPQRVKGDQHIKYHMHGDENPIESEICN